ncbi:hypothetical protein CIHG_09920 [Coccidioides immitis H538.4]|uniref:Uncharacterized protein n=3 Tax=Coccidioides immitis TaxID=5501 RepID=A0A0J8QZ69_COCIT|nr:hypothetical protein CIRG_01521 [Coccidioides immitis RMSCC 2394]KMU77355.1 hypothetical protein CISG_06396 [Coccidioides immitis RMSCC 3703]KMU92082.1 hypothetical protein CIHG_09920 [Coccidioides immitis H538.4]
MQRSGGIGGSGILGLDSTPGLISFGETVGDGSRWSFASESEPVSVPICHFGLVPHLRVDFIPSQARQTGHQAAHKFFREGKGRFTDPVGLLVIGPDVKR